MNGHESSAPTSGLATASVNPDANCSRDVVVVLPGITGSTLYLHGKPVWEPSVQAIINAIASFGHNVKALTLHDVGDQAANDGVEARALIHDLHNLPGVWSPIRGYNQLVDRLKSMGYREPTADAPGNLLAIPYDWRLSCRYTADWMTPMICRELGRWRAAGNPDAEVVFIGHSMGGLVARWYACHQGADHTKMLITLGTPYRGAMKALRYLAEGAPPKLGPLASLLTGIARSLPSLHQLLPAYACVMNGKGEPRHLDPANLPDVSPDLARDGLDFYAELERLETAKPGLLSHHTYPFVGIGQRTDCTVSIDAGELRFHETYGSADFRGDGTVPLPGATISGLPLNTPINKPIAENHGSLQCHRTVLDMIEATLLGAEVVIMGGSSPAPIGVRTPEVAVAGEPLTVEVDAPELSPTIRVTIRPDGSPVPERTAMVYPGYGVSAATFDGLAPGGYLAVAEPVDASPLATVTTPFVIWPGGPEAGGAL